MNIKCIFKHKWKHYYEDSIVYPPGNNNPIKIVNDKKIRICEKCFKKQISKINYRYGIITGDDKYDTYTTWSNSDLNKSEERDFKLNKIGI